jgi:hypothetical protein
MMKEGNPNGTTQNDGNHQVRLCVLFSRSESMDKVLGTVRTVVRKSVCGRCKVGA